MTEPFRLQPHERTNPLWVGLEAHLKRELDTLRRQNDASLTVERTENIRGRIAQVKAILALAEDKPAQT